MKQARRSFLKMVGCFVSSIAISTLGAMYAVGCTSIANDIGKSWVFSSHRIIQESIPTPSGKNNIATSVFDFLTPHVGSLAYSNDMRSFQLSGMLSPLRVVSPFDDETILNNEGAISSVTASPQSRAPRNRFEMAKAVILTTEDGTEAVFDHDFSPNDAFPDRNTDINNPSFLKKLVSLDLGQRVNKISFVLRDEAESSYWRRNFSNEVGSKISAIDLYTGILWSFFTTPRSRVSSNLFGDNNSHGKLSELISMLIVAARVNNFPEYLRSPSIGSRFSIWDELALPATLGLETNFVELLLNETSPTSRVSSFSNSKAFSLSFSAAASGNYKADLWRMFQKAQINAMPFHAFQDLKDKYDSKLISVVGPLLSNSELALFLESPFYKLGFFHIFFAKGSDFYWGGKYYLSEASERFVSVKANSNYVDPRFFSQVNSMGDRTTIEEYRYKFVTADNRLGQLNDYKSGSNVVADYSLLSLDEKVAARVGQGAKYGVKYEAPYESSVTPFNDFTSLNLLPISHSAKSGYYFNDNFSKLLYGLTTAQLSEGNINYLPHLLAGEGLRFRKLLNAAYNAFTFAKQYTRNNRYSIGDRLNWNSLYAPDFVVGTQTLFSLSQDVNSPAYHLNSKYIIDLKDGEASLKPLLDQYYINAFAAEIGYEKFGLGQVTADVLGTSPSMYLKKEFKKLLDEQLEFSMENEITWEMPYGLGAQYTTIDAQEIYSNWKSFLKTIDPRLNVVAIMSPSLRIDNKYKEASIIVDDWPKDTSFRVISKQYDPGSFFYHYEDRTPDFNSQAGNNFANAYGGSYYDFLEGPLTPIFYNYQDFRRGQLLVHSFYSDPNNSHFLTSSNQLKVLLPLIKKIEVEFDNHIGSFSADNIGLSSTEKGAIISAIMSLKFSTLWQSNSTSLASHGLLGFFGLDRISELAIKSRDLKVTGDLAKTVSYLQIFFSKIAKDAANEYANSLAKNDLLELMNSLQIVSPENFNPLTSTIYPRSALVPRVEKNWFHRATLTSDNTPVDVSRHRVDLDYAYIGQYYRAIYLSTTGEYKDALNGGIVF